MSGNTFSSRAARSRILIYWLLRGFTFSIAVFLGLYIVAAYVAIPFYAAEGYTAQFEDRILGLIVDFLLFITILIPHRWTLTSPGYEVRVGMIIFAVLWILIVDVIAYKRGLTNGLFSPHNCIALLTGIALYATLAMQFNESRRRTSACS